MMTKHTSRRRAMLAGSAMALIVLFSGFGFSGRTSVSSGKKGPAPAAPVPAIAKNEGDISPELYFKGATIWQKNKAGTYEAKKYEAMTAAEKAALLPVPALRVLRTKLTAAQFKLWSDSARYPVTVLYEGPKWKHTTARKLRPEDYVAYSLRPMNLRPHSFSNKTSKWIRYTDVMLMTEAYYQEAFIKPRFEPNKELTLAVTGAYYYLGPPVPATPGRKPMVTYPAP